VLVALVFIAVFSAGLASVSLSVVRGNAQAKATDTAAFLALDLLEVIRNTPYAGVTSAAFPAQGYGSISIGGVAFPDFQRAASVQNDTPMAGMKRVVVTVSWRGGSVSEEMLVGQ
jgi:Tfp pilus assembly protein PilV